MQTKTQRGIILEIEQMVTNCSVCVCADYAKKQPSEPQKPYVPLSLPWKKIGTDLYSSVENIIYSLCATAANSLKSQSWNFSEVVR